MNSRVRGWASAGHWSWAQPGRHGEGGILFRHATKEDLFGGFNQHQIDNHHQQKCAKVGCRQRREIKQLA
jgi:hypothetical protein